jgi:hypothetical protein
MYRSVLIAERNKNKRSRDVRENRDVTSGAQYSIATHQIDAPWFFFLYQLQLVCYFITSSHQAVRFQVRKQNGKTPPKTVEKA